MSKDLSGLCADQLNRSHARRVMGSPKRIIDWSNLRRRGQKKPIFENMGEGRRMIMTLYDHYKHITFGNRSFVKCYLLYSKYADDLKTSNGILVTGTLFLKGTSKGADGTRRRPLSPPNNSSEDIGCTERREEETTLSLPSATKGFLAAGVKEQFSASLFARLSRLVFSHALNHIVKSPKRLISSLLSVAFRLVTYAQARAYHRSMVSDTERSNGGSDTIVSDRGMNPRLISPPPDIGILLQRSGDSGIPLRDS
ncbi:hypothetical protein CEXT_171541 [Caerostris extrusa]|uniref:Uncharacterized protein n=1 Tax=Caerostris extrusa TaxID=172846 RepID=A0AAV4QXD7_CAEEX|nr:hypothetical protein CEXT_171541 [Caerostris extrusa]